MVYNVEVEIEGENGQQELDPQRARGAGAATAIQYSGGVETGYGVDEEDIYEEDAVPVVQQRRVDENEQLGRNDPCWCGSGKKFKKCHGA